MNRFLVVTTLLVIGCFGAIATAEAQDILGHGTHTTSDTAAPSAPVVVGWNWFHIANCSLAGGFMYLYPVESNGITYLWTAVPLPYTTLASACQSGNLIAVHITDLSLLAWDGLFTYTFK
jgi:hypothetical protein